MKMGGHNGENLARNLRKAAKAAKKRQWPDRKKKNRLKPKRRLKTFGLEEDL